MKKINDTEWQNIKPSSIFAPLKPGGYVARIVSVEDVADREFLKIYFDIIEGDFTDYFREQFNRFGDRWPNSGTLYRSYKQSALGMFKRFISCIEQSNPGFSWAWCESALNDADFGVVMVEDSYTDSQGVKHCSLKAKEVYTVDQIRGNKFYVPTQKKVTDPHGAFTELEDANESTLPF